MLQHHRQALGDIAVVIDEENVLAVVHAVIFRAMRPVTRLWVSR
jgi:hypothetical protein